MKHVCDGRERGAQPGCRDAAPPPRGPGTPGDASEELGECLPGYAAGKGWRRRGGDAG